MQSERKKRRKKKKNSDIKNTVVHLWVTVTFRDVISVTVATMPAASSASLAGAGVVTAEVTGP